MASMDPIPPVEFKMRNKKEKIKEKRKKDFTISTVKLARYALAWA